jgi:1-deoxy-D-xylulose-5-phosphate synthase
MTELALGKGVIRRQGEKVALLAFGPLLQACHTAAEQLNATLVDMRFVKPLDQQLLTELSKTHSHFVTIEDNALMGGAGSAVNEYCIAEQLPVKLLNIGLPDIFIKHGTQEQIYAELGLDSAGIQAKVEVFLRR